jgi:two-component sensor histidine kinase
LDIPEKPLPVALEVAVPCGLVVNELLTNAVKHAFAGSCEKRITIALLASGPDIELSVRDNGRGMPPGFDVREQGRMGWQTIIAIVETQLRGTVAVSSGLGTTVDIRFPANLYDEKV